MIIILFMQNVLSTKPRQLIYECLKQNSQKHVTVSDIVAMLQTIDKKIGIATVYRTMEYFEQQNIVKKFISDISDKACYQFIDTNAPQKHTQYHLKCSNCNELFHFECDQIANLSNHIQQEHDFFVQTEKIIFLGLCKKCQNKI